MMTQLLPLNTFATRPSAAVSVLAFLLATVVGTSAARAEPAACLSPDANQWPAPSIPYMMLAVDTSGSMTACTTPSSVYPAECDQNAAGYQLNSCGLVPSRMNDAKCALRQTIQAFSGQVNFGLATFAVEQTGCAANCISECAPFNGGNCEQDSNGCAVDCFASEISTTGLCGGCGPMPGAAATRAGALIRVPMLQDHFWATPPEPSNVPDLLAWFDGSCAGNQELFATGKTPLNGMLRDMNRYFESGWTAPDSSASFLSPLDANDNLGAGINGGTACRSVNIILVTDGDESCDSQQDAVNAAAALYDTGVTVGSKTFKIRTHVINFAGGTQTNTDAIAAAGGTGQSIFATNEVELAQGLASIVQSALPAEVCDNIDNNCNGCTDEGFNHYCNTGQNCCAWSDNTGREACLAAYQASISASDPDGDLEKLPCVSVSQQQVPATWLCFDPADTCDEVDNNCQFGVDEGQLKCGTTAHCPTAETCNGEDDDCDGQTDEGGVCGGCVPTVEICDGCDNDCDGVADNPPPGGFADKACGLPSPAWCLGTVACQSPQAVPEGTCAMGAGYGACTNSPATEICDGIDNDCNSAVDDGINSIACDPPSNAPGLVYGGTSQCTQGVTQCTNGNTECLGGTGPSTEICDGIDNDCNGVVDDQAFGVGQQCGNNTLPCQPGTTSCVNGAMQCVGGVGPQAEVCDGADNDCDGGVDEVPLADAPAANQTGCWNTAGTSCSHENLSWDPPTLGNCHDAGTLSAPCQAGVLQCAGASGWSCVQPVAPQAEVCDGIDNDCNSAVDDGNLPQVGDTCGSNIGECIEGSLICNNGVLDCDGDTPPAEEICDGLDNDCDGLPDNGIPAGPVCDMLYDVTVYPGDRSNAPCQQGMEECDGFGNMVCVGGTAPQPEVCDGLDNDCDGQVDENGVAPDGLDGSANPLPPPAASLGDACGQSEGECQPGGYVCLNGLFACVGGIGPVVEQCDCLDNDCDGTVDELPGTGEPVLCSPGKDCVSAPDGCQCAEPCKSGEYPCPYGQKCEQLTISGSNTTGSYCVTDYEIYCGDCEQKTVKDANDNVLCAPAGTDAPGCLLTPVCECKGPAGCQEPCYNVDCASGTVCSNFGPKAGKCVADTCYLTGCPGCNKVCHQGVCLNNPCQPGSCPLDQVCKPSADFMSFSCVSSCADVDCPTGEICVDGACVPSCNPPCADGEVCDPSGPSCVPDKCAADDPCADGACCDPLTGICGDCPCEGVLCPPEQVCQDGECVSAESSNNNGAGGSGGGSTGSGTGNNNPSGGAGDASEPSLWGLPTGGGGCACAQAGRPQGTNWHGFGVVAMALLLWRRRRPGAVGADKQGCSR